MITMLLILTIASCVVEYKLTDRHHGIRVWLGNHKVIALFASTILSVFLGGLFGAAGLITFGAGMLSTVVMNVVYAAMPHLERNRQAIAVATGAIKALLSLIVNVVIAPFRFIGWVMSKCGVDMEALANR